MKKTVSLLAAIALMTGCSQWREKMGSSKEVSFNDLPAPVQQTVRNEIGDKTIAKITQGEKNGQTAYKITVEAKGPNPALWVSSDGSIIKESRRVGKGANEAAGASSSKKMENSSDQKSQTDSSSSSSSSESQPQSNQNSQSTSGQGQQQSNP